MSETIRVPEPTGEPEPIKWTAIYIDGVSYPLTDEPAEEQDVKHGP